MTHLAYHLAEDFCLATFFCSVVMTILEMKPISCNKGAKLVTSNEVVVTGGESKRRRSYILVFGSSQLRINKGLEKSG